MSFVALPGCPLLAPNGRARFAPPPGAGRLRYLRAVDDGQLIEPSVRVVDDLLELELPQETAPVAPRTSRLFDLVYTHRVVSRGLATTRFAAGGLRLGLASDLHVADLWDPIVDAAVELLGPEGIAHPSAHLAHFVAEMNQRHAKGALDAVVLVGDLVDHVYATPRHLTAERRPNVERFVRELARLEAPSFVVPGNHDYRLDPYRPRVYGLDTIGVPRGAMRAVLERAGLWDRHRLRWSDRGALAVRHQSGESGLVHHLERLAPASYRLRVGGFELAFLDSGPDRFTAWRSELRRDPRGYIRQLASVWGEPDSLGPEVEDLSGVDAVFVHAPLATPRGALDCVASVRALDRAGARRGVSSRGAEALIDGLRGQVRLVVSGHTHRCGALTVEGGRVRTADLEGRGQGVALTLPALGHLDGSPPGFAIAVLHSDRAAWRVESFSPIARVDRAYLS